MKYFIKIFIVVILTANVSYNCIAQESYVRKAFISINSGLFLPTWSEFKETYHSPLVFINGVSLGVPFTNKNFFFYAKGMYFQKTGTQIIYNFERDPLTGELNMYTTRGGDITWRQLLGNIGIQYNLNLEQKNNLIFNGGLTLEKTSEGEVKQNISLSGFFFGIGYEKRILEKFSLFSEVQYNFSIVNMLKIELFGHELKLKNGGVNFNVGGRYYFSLK